MPLRRMTDQEVEVALEHDRQVVIREAERVIARWLGWRGWIYEKFKGRCYTLLYLGPNTWTHALAAAIKEMKLGDPGEHRDDNFPEGGGDDA